MLPLIGPRGLAAARAAGARVVLHLHNVRLFCAIGVASRDGGPCFRCRGRLTLPGLVLNCRGSLPEAAAYAAGAGAAPAARSSRRRPLRGAQPLRRPGSWRSWACRASGSRCCSHYLPAEAFAERSRAPRGRLRAGGRAAVRGEGARRRGRGGRGGGRAAAGGGRRARPRPSSASWRAGSTRRSSCSAGSAASGSPAARRRGGAGHALALPRVLAVLGAGGDGGGRAGGGHADGRGARADRERALRAARRRGRARRAAASAVGRPRPCAAPRARRCSPARASATPRSATCATCSAIYERSVRRGLRRA